MLQLLCESYNSTGRELNWAKGLPAEQEAVGSPMLGRGPTAPATTAMTCQRHSPILCRHPWQGQTCMHGAKAQILLCMRLHLQYASDFRRNLLPCPHSMQDELHFVMLRVHRKVTLGAYTLAAPSPALGMLAALPAAGNSQRHSLGLDAAAAAVLLAPADQRSVTHYLQALPHLFA